MGCKLRNTLKESATLEKQGSELMMRKQGYGLFLIAIATLIGSGTAWSQTQKRMETHESGMRTEGGGKVSKKVSAKEKRLTKSYTKKIQRFRRTDGGKELKESDWFVTGIRKGNKAEFGQIGNEKKAIQWSVQQALTKNKNRTWKVLGRFADQNTAAKFVQRMQAEFEQQLVRERQIAVRNAELARQAALARQRSFQQHSGGSC